MKKDCTKILWKIEELWNQFYKLEKTISPSVLGNYVNGISKYYSDFHLVNEFSFKESNLIVHRDNYGEYKGLLNSQLLFKNKKPIYLFDNHNKMIYPIVELFNSLKQQIDIVHIDAHPDDAQFQGVRKNSLKPGEVEGYIKETRISDFFDALSETSIVNRVFPVTHSDSFEFFLPPEESYVLSLDIDIFGPEGDFCELKDKVRAIALAWSRADVVCIAMSPGFIDQEYAQKIIDIFIVNS